MYIIVYIRIATWEDTRISTTMAMKYGDDAPELGSMGGVLVSIT